MTSDRNTQLRIPKVIVTDADEQDSAPNNRRARSSSPTLSATGYSSNQASASSAELVSPADILTFRYMGNTSRKGKQVWVDTPTTYDAAVDRVVTEFRHELGSVDKRDVAFYVGAKVGAADAGREAHGAVRIGRTDEAWKRVISTLVRYEIIEVHIDGPDPSITPPAYSPPAEKEVEWVPATKPLTAGRDRKSPHRRLASWLGH